MGFEKPNEIAYHISVKSVNDGLMWKTTWGNIISQIYIDYRNLVEPLLPSKCNSHTSIDRVTMYYIFELWMEA